MVEEYLKKLTEKIKEIIESPETLNKFLKEKLTAKELDELEVFWHMARELVGKDLTDEITAWFVAAYVAGQIMKFKVYFTGALCTSILLAVKKRPYREILQYLKEGFL